MDAVLADGDNISLASCSEQSIDLQPVKDEEIDVYKTKFERLYARCEDIQVDNERLINHIYQVKRLVYRYRKQRRSLTRKLDSLGDQYRQAQCPLFQELPVPNAKSAKIVRNGGIGFNSNTGGKSSGKRTKDGSKDSKSNPLAPKKPINPYLLFCQENRSVIQERNMTANGSEMSNQELTKAMAQNWHDLSSDEKQVYYNLYEHEKERYENELKAFNESQKLAAQSASSTVAVSSSSNSIKKEN